MMQRERGLLEWIADDPFRALRTLRTIGNAGRFGPRPTSGALTAEGPAWTRRLLLSRSGHAALAFALCGALPPWRGFVPAAFAGEAPFAVEGKDAGLVLLNDRPLNAETPAHLLDDAVTPASRFFIRNNGIPPEESDPQTWRLTLEGEAVGDARSFSIADLKNQFEHHTYRLQLECGGNGRAEFFPPAKGNQWTTGAVGCAEWTGVRLRDLLDAVSTTPRAVYVAFEGADRHLSGDPEKRPISRGVPIAKARQDETLVAWAMNGADIPALHGAPLRLVCGGWPGSTSGKWLRRLLVRDRVHDGAKMGGQSYRVPCEPVAPGSVIPDEAMCIIESMPVKSLITFPRSGVVHPMAQPFEVRGSAWAGERSVAALHLSTDFGQTWQPARLDPRAQSAGVAAL